MNNDSYVVLFEYVNCSLDCGGSIVSICNNPEPHQLVYRRSSSGYDNAIVTFMGEARRGLGGCVGSQRRRLGNQGELVLVR